MKPLLRILVVFLGLLQPAALAAQNAGNTADSIQAYDREIALIADSFDRAREDDDKMVGLSERLRAISKNIIVTGVDISPRLSEIRARLDQLGPAADHGGEPEQITQERNRLLEERAIINTDLGQLETLSIRVNTLLNAISEARRDLFTSTLSRRYDITAAFGYEVLTDVTDRLDILATKVGSWMRFAWSYKFGSMLAATVLSWVAAIFFLVFARRLLGQLVHRDPKAEDPGYFSRLAAGFLGTLLPALAVVLFLTLIYALYQYFDVLRGDIGKLLLTFFLGIGVVTLIWQLADAVFAPGLPQWRLVPVTNRSAKILKRLAIAVAVIIVSDVLLTQILEVVGNSLPVTVAKSLITSLLVGIILLLIASEHPFRHDDGEAGAPWPLVVRLLLYSSGATLIVAALAGYIGFAEFAAKQLVVTGAVAATMYLGYLAAQALSREHAFAQSSGGKRLRARYDLTEGQLERFGLFSGLLLMVAVIATGIPVLLIVWGFKWADIRGWAVGALTEFSVGSIDISITGLFIGFLVFIAGYWITKLFQRWLDRDVLVRSRVDTGVRNSIRTAVGYAGVTLAVVIGIGAAGIDLSKLALVAGALSVGIGFGLQNVVSNFVSGLILLAERPFKVGDWIEASGISGTVTSINVRATEIETFQRKTIILPNSELINSAVGNWTLRNTLGRIEVPVGVSYKSDPTAVRDILLEIARDHPRILANPEPFVVFADFGNSSLDFELRAYLADVNYILTVGTELRFEIFERFKAAGIEIPFPQRDVNLHVVEKDREVVESSLKRAKFGGVGASREKPEAG